MPTRREMIKSAAVLTVSAAATEAALGAPRTKAATMHRVPFEIHEKVRVGFIGCGGRGGGLFNDLLNIPNVEIKATCDVVGERAERFAARAASKGQKMPEIYTKGERDFERLCARDDIDIVYSATPWDWHVPTAVCAMEHGKHAAIEVPTALTLAECWKLVDTSERTRRHCVQLENCCYGHTEMLVKNMVKKGLFGEIVHGEAAYLHDLRGLLLADESEGLWRRFPHINRNGNLYPTHGLGPVAQYMGIHDGDRFTKLVSMSSVERGLTEYRDANLPKGSPKRKEIYKCGDINTSLIQTALGRTIVLQHTVTLPRPYSRLNIVTGTKGTFMDYPARFYVEGQEGGEDWADIDKYKQYEDPLWQKEGEMARKLGGHGGMDFIMNYRLMECLHLGIAPDMDVYDAAAWSAPGPLSELSVAKNSTSIDFPDFTRGKWKV
jgi:predicted dehydrogenase